VDDEEKWNSGPRSILQMATRLKWKLAGLGWTVAMKRDQKNMATYFSKID